MAIRSTEGLARIKAGALQPVYSRQFREQLDTGQPATYPAVTTGGKWWENNSAVQFWFRPELTGYNPGDLVDVVPDSGPHGHDGSSSGAQRTTFRANIFGTLPALEGNGSTTEVVLDAMAAAFSGVDVPFYFDGYSYQPVPDPGIQGTLFNIAGPATAIHDFYYGGFRGSYWVDRYDDGFARKARDLGGDLDTDRHFLQYLYTGSRHALWVDGLQVWDVPTVSGTLTVSGARLMSHTRPSLTINGSFKGYVGEVLFVQDTPSDGQIRSRGAYQAARAGLSYGSGQIPWAPYSERNGHTNYPVFIWVRDDCFGNVAGGANVPAWYSKTPFRTGYSLEQYSERSAGNGPVRQLAGINGRSSARFSVGKYMTGNPLAAGFVGTGKPWTHWAVVQLDSAAVRYIVWSLLSSTIANTAGYGEFTALGAYNWLRQQDSGAFNQNGGGATSTSAVRLVARYDGSAFSAWVNGVQIVNQVAWNSGAFTPDEMWLGAFSAGVVPYAGLVADLGFADEAWDATTLAKLEAYLVDRWF